MRRSMWCFACALIALTFFLLLSCAATPQRPFTGSWVNESAGQRNYRYVYGADGKIQGFGSPDSKAPEMEGRYVVEKSQIDSVGSSWFWIKERWSGAPFSDASPSVWYVLVKVAKDGTTFEQDASLGHYPDGFSPDTLGHGFHCIYRLEK